MIFKYDLLVRPATPLAASLPFAPAQIIQILDRGGEAKQVVQLLVSEETGGGHLHLQTIGEVPQGADAVLHDLMRDGRVNNQHRGQITTLRMLTFKVSQLSQTASHPLCILSIISIHVFFSFHFNPTVVGDSPSQQEQSTIMRSYSADIRQY